jgi:nucleoside-specific outer membrane channel protein Tsx
MKVVIQDMQTGQYLAADDTWTSNVGAAKDFRFRPRAFDAVRLEHDRHSRVVYYFEDLDYAIGARNWKDHGWAHLCAAA